VSGRRAWGVWGVGPRIVIATVGCFVLLRVLGATFPALRMGERPPVALATLAGILMAAVVVWIVVIREVRPAHFAGRLVTGGACPRWSRAFAARVARDRLGPERWAQRRRRRPADPAL